MIKALNEPPTHWLDLPTCERIYKSAVSDPNFGSLPSFSSRYPGKLEGILGSVSQTAFGEYLHSSISDAATAYFYQIISGHPFPDGNKRCSILFLNVFLELHGLRIDIPQDEMYQFAVLIAASDARERDRVRAAIRDVLRDHVIKT